MVDTEEKSTEPKIKNNDVFEDDFKKEIPSLVAELAFIFLPFVVILIVNLLIGDWNKLIQTSDWSLAATLLFGQTIVKIIMGVASQEHSFNHQNLGLISALIIVFGLVPSLVILAIFQMTQDISIGLVIAQFLLLGLSIIVFLLFGTIGQVLYSTAFKNKIAKKLGLIK